MHAFKSMYTAALLAALVPGALAAQDPMQRPGTPEIAVTGQGEARATPDRAMITIGVQSRATTAASAAAANARKQNAILDTLRAIGFRQEQVTTDNYSVQPDMQYDERGQRPRILGYIVTNTVRVEVRDIDRAGPALDAALAKGANTVYGPTFFLSNPAPVRREAVTAAFANARAEAEALASAAGGTLGPIIQMSSNFTPMMPRGGMEPVYSAAASDMAAKSTPIEVGDQRVQAMVNIRWTFVPGR